MARRHRWCSGEFYEVQQVASVALIWWWCVGDIVFDINVRLLDGSHAYFRSERMENDALGMIFPVGGAIEGPTALLAPCFCLPVKTLCNGGVRGVIISLEALLWSKVW